uniref:Putative receptor-binding cancer antigen n=1 Tax=Xenopsylla cheopis TaxID=163159 RepID=A0A6M2DXN5_XENCH
MSLLITKLKGLFLIILSVFRRALCCFRKRRRNSHCESEILTTIGIVPAYSNTTETKIKPDDQNWNSWEEKPVTIQDHIERYRQQRIAIKEASPEPVPDYFQDMTPKLTRQPKVLIQTQNNLEVNQVSRLAVNNAVPITADLETWDDNKNGWEDESENAMEILREKRRQERREQLEKGQQKKHEPRPVIAAKRN